MAEGCRVRGSWQLTFFSTIDVCRALNEAHNMHYFTLSAQQPPKEEILPCFSDEEIEAQRGEFTCLRSHR